MMDFSYGPNLSPDEYCQQKAAQSGSSFYYSFLFLPAARRRAITALYAFCREVDDAVDEPADPQVARAKLEWWRHKVAQLYAGHASTRSREPWSRRSCRSTSSSGSWERS